MLRYVVFAVHSNMENFTLAFVHFVFNSESIGFGGEPSYLTIIGNIAIVIEKK